MKILVTLLFITCMFSALFGSIGIPNNKLNIIKNYRLKNWDISKFDLDLSAAGDLTDSNVDTKNLQLNLDPYYERLIESDKRTFTFNNDFSTNYDLSKYETGSVESNGNRISFSDDMYTSWRMYFSDLFSIKTSALISAVYTNDRSDDKDEINGDSNELYESTRLQGTVFLGFGIGRIYNVTPVIRALRINERMKEMGKQELSSEEIEDVAFLISREDDYDFYFQRPDKFFWRDISGKTHGKLDNMTVLEYEYMKESMLENIGHRYEGIAFDAGLSLYRYTKRDYERSDSLFSNDRTENFRFGPSINFDYYNNLTTSLQIGFTYSADMGFDTMTDDELNEYFTNYIGAEVLYNITDRLLFTNNINYTFTQYSDKIFDIDLFENDDSDNSNLYVSSNLNYMILDKVDLFAGLYLQNRNDIQSSTFRTGINTGVRVYLFDRIYRGK